MAGGGNSDLSPLFTVRVGSPAFPNWGEFGSSILKDGYTRMATDNEGRDFMSGTSEYTNNKNSLHFDVGVSGSAYTPVGTFSAAVAVGYSSAHAETEQNISIEMNAIRYSGVEVLDLDDLSFDELLGVLDENVAADIEVVLDLFLAANKDNTDQSAMSDWVRALEKFFDRYGAGLVVGVVWGGWGQVRMDMEIGSSDDKWALSQKGKFSWKGGFGAASVNEAVGLDKDDTKVSKKASVTSNFHGGCVSGLIASWEDDLRKRMTDEVGKIGETSVADLKSADVTAPAVLEPKKAEKKQGVADKIKEIKDLDGLKAFAQASAYDAYKKDHPKATLSDFLNAAEQKTDLSGVPDDPYDADSESDDERSIDEGAGDTAVSQGMTGPVGGSGDGHGKDDNGAPHDGFQPGSDFVALGAWVAPWGNICPWLVRGKNNMLDAKSSNDINQMLRGLAAQHAFTSLARIYQRLAAENMSIDDKSSGTFPELANEFASAAIKISQALMKGNGSVLLSDILSSFTVGARKIYQTWMENPVLRQCELGAGVLIYSESKDVNGFKVMKGVTSKKYRVKFPSYDLPVYDWDRHSFDYSSWNVTAFAQTVKAWPFILPNGKISAFIAGARPGGSDFLRDRPPDEGFQIPTFGSGILQGDGDPARRQPIVESSTITKPMTFDVVDESEHATLYYKGDADGEFGDFRLRLIPLPFTAADGVDNWQGCAMTPDLSDTRAQIAMIRDKLSGLDSVEFDLEAWTDALSVRPSKAGLRPTYVGLVPEPPNVFPNSSRR